MLNLDTHVLVHVLRRDLRPRQRELLAGDSWSVAAIVLRELAQLGRLTIALDDPDVKVALSKLHVWPLDLDVARASTRLHFQRDPADVLIAAASVAHRVPLLTRDRRIRRSKLVPFAA